VHGLTLGSPSGSCAGGQFGNGPTDGSDAYSNATAGVFGARRTLLDDFWFDGGGGSAGVGGVLWTHIWDSGAPPLGTGAEFLLRSDAAGSPGPPLTGDLVVGYAEAPTGNVWFSRPEAGSGADLAGMVLDPGVYWLEGTVIGPVNDFWLVRSTVAGSPCWTNYEDFGGLLPGSSVYGVPADLNLCLWYAFLDVSTYCDPSGGHPNNSATISASSSSLSTTITLDLSNGPPGQFCYLLIGDDDNVVNQPGGSKGDLCVVGGSCLGRYSKDVGAITPAGTFSTDIEHPASSGTTYGVPICGGTIDAGETWYFQYWHRQPMGQASTFSQAIALTFVN